MWFQTPKYAGAHTGVTGACPCTYFKGALPLNPNPYPNHPQNPNPNPYPDPNHDHTPKACTYFCRALPLNLRSCLSTAPRFVPAPR